MSAETRQLVEKIREEVRRGDYTRALKLLAENKHLYSVAPQLKQLEVILRLVARTAGYRARPPDPATMKRIESILRRVS